MFLKILAHPVFANLNFHMPLIVDLSHPLILLKGENGCGKSTLLHAIYYALRGDEIDRYIYKLEDGKSNASRVMLF
ncbi:MAG TPA: ATP-binding protein, partial [Bryobacteraceae bacterium]|nr:ATP-binding protein [Bryobacteraceae bacterium]